MLGRLTHGFCDYRETPEHSFLPPFSQTHSEQIWGYDAKHWSESTGERNLMGSSRQNQLESARVVLHAFKAGRCLNLKDENNKYILGTQGSLFIRSWLCLSFQAANLQRRPPIHTVPV